MAILNTPIPGVDQYGQQMLDAKDAYKRAVNRLNQNALSGYRDFGFDADIDSETGAISNVHAAADKPYGQFQQMLRGHAGANDQLNNQLAGRHLHGGLANRAHTEQQYGFGLDEHNLGNAMLGLEGQHGAAFAQAGYDRDQAITQAQWAAAQAAIANGNFTPADFSGVSPTPYGDPNAVVTPGVIAGPRTSYGNTIAAGPGFVQVPGFNTKLSTKPTTKTNVQAQVAKKVAAKGKKIAI